MQEREWKRLVLKEEFEALLQIASCLAGMRGEESVQINHYYDTIDHRLGKDGICVRIRQTEDGSLSGTVKKHGENGISEERCFRVEKLPRFVTYESTLLHRLGALVTKRVNFRLKGFGILSFDRSFYLGTSDYELELELFEDAQVPGKALFVPNGGADKYTRFLSALARFEELHESGADAGEEVQK